jgi:hypothetical protein
LTEVPNLAMRDRTVLESLQVAEAHVASELTNDIDRIMKTVTSHPRYAFITSEDDQRNVSIMTTAEQVRKFYSWQRANSHKVLVSRHIRQVASDWYVFYESVPTREDARTRRAYVTNSVVMLPTAADGIVGELLWERDRSSANEASADALPGADPGLPFAEVNNLEVHNAFLRAFKANEVSEIAGLLDDGCILVARDDVFGGRPLSAHRGREAVRRYLDRWFTRSKIVHMILLNRVIGSWYAFAELHLVIQINDGSFRQYRYAAITPFTSGRKVASILSYQTPLESYKASDSAT